MKILIWNCRGMNKFMAVRALQVLLERIRPDVVFLSESHLSRAKAGVLMRRFHFDEMEIHESDGRSGGLVMWWHSSLNVTSTEVSPNFIDVRVDEHTVSAWRFTGFYGEPSADRKHLSWQYIRDLKAMNNIPWLIGGDFNDIMFGSEKEGGNIRPQRCMQLFREADDDCSLEDLGFIGEEFTWQRGRIRERLDRVFGNQDGLAMFPALGVIHEGWDKSDHRPILMDTDFYLQSQERRRPAPKRFYARWLCEESVDTIVQATWD